MVKPLLNKFGFYNGMRLKSLLLFFIFIQGTCVFAQKPWIDCSYRDSTFPKDTYYISYYKLLNESNVDECVSKTILGVRSMLANSIYSEVSSISRSSTNVINVDGNYSETESFVNEFSSAASAKLVNVNIDYFFDKSSNTAHAIAYVKKQDLSDFCENKLLAGINSLTSSPFYQAVEICHKEIKEIKRGNK